MRSIPELAGVVNSIVSDQTVRFRFWLQDFLAMTFDKLLKLAVPQFPHQRKEIIALNLIETLSGSSEILSHSC